MSQDCLKYFGLSGIIHPQRRLLCGFRISGLVRVVGDPLALSIQGLCDTLLFFLSSNRKWFPHIKTTLCLVSVSPRQLFHLFVIKEKSMHICNGSVNILVLSCVWIVNWVSYSWQRHLYVFADWTTLVLAPPSCQFIDDVRFNQWNYLLMCAVTVDVSRFPRVSA